LVSVVTFVSTSVDNNVTVIEMANGKFISYLRVSTDRQGRSGLGLEAQREAITCYLNGGEWALVAEVVEVESGKRNDRPKLAEALASCRLHGAVLLIAKIDRLARNAAFLLSLRDAGVEFLAVDMPNANRLTVGIMALVAEDEAERISARTKAALAAAKARGTKLGGLRPGALPNAAEGRAKGRAVRSENAQARAADLAPVIDAIRAAGATSLREIATELNGRNIPTARGGRWSAVQVQRVLDCAQPAAA
jgi:DNA invertase Pin-like site-specific DNA recombinase